jgi:hypothetical protein
MRSPLNNVWQNVLSAPLGTSSTHAWTPQIKPYFTVDNTGNNQALVDAQIKITLTGADITIASIVADGSNLYFYHKDTFLHSYINYLSATVCECYVKVSCPALSNINIGLKLQTHSFTNDYSGVMIRRTAHSSTNMLYTCANANDSLSHGPTIGLVNGAAILSTKFGNVYSFDGSNDYGTLDVLKTIPAYGGFGFNFVLPDNSWDNGALHTLFSKVYTDAKSYFIIQIQINGLLKIYTGDGTNDSFWISATKPEIGKIHSYYIKWTSNSTIIYYDGEIVCAKNKKITTSPTNPDTCFFGAYNTTLQFCKVYIFDVEYNNSSLPITYQRARAENISIFNRTQSEKLSYVSNLPATISSKTVWGESSLIFDNNILYCYHQKTYTDDDHLLTRNIFVLSTSSDFGVTWDAPVTLAGYGTAIEPTMGIFRSFVFKDNDGKVYWIYMLYDTPGPTTLYIREITGHTTIGARNTFLTNTYGNIDNCSIINDNGVYKGLVDVTMTIDSFSSYVQYYIQGNTLLTMGYPSATRQSSIGVRSQYNYGAPMFLKVGNKYCCWTEQSLVNEKAILPDQCYYSECTDPSTNTWVTKPVSILALDSQYADDQNVDGSIVEHNGVTYFMTGKNNNISPFLCIMTLYKYNGTVAQFIKDIEVIHHD